eukprot:2897962-Rhodomonas_salina.3
MWFGLLRYFCVMRCPVLTSVCCYQIGNGEEWLERLGKVTSPPIALRGRYTAKSNESNRRLRTICTRLLIDFVPHMRRLVLTWHMVVPLGGCGSGVAGCGTPPGEYQSTAAHTNRCLALYNRDASSAPTIRNTAECSSVPQCTRVYHTTTPHTTPFELQHGQSSRDTPCSTCAVYCVLFLLFSSFFPADTVSDDVIHKRAGAEERCARARARREEGGEHAGAQEPPRPRGPQRLPPLVSSVEKRVEKRVKQRVRKSARGSGAAPGRSKLSRTRAELSS